MGAVWVTQEHVFVKAYRTVLRLTAFCSIGILGKKELCINTEFQLLGSFSVVAETNNFETTFWCILDLNK
jgi:hypothetical protein